ncbi:MAG TPA: hypothetical protein VM598_12455, partial [Bdellovibrionota bacterium]|nr:hypothetical protein [Bdellovibrionota bacterium]
MKVLFLTDELPYPVSGTSRIREAQLIEILAEAGEVEVLSFSHPGDAPVTSVPSQISLTAIEREPEPAWRKLFSPLRPSAFEGLCEAMIDALRIRVEPGKLLWVSGIEAA